jgi:hypothetical protein
MLTITKINKIIPLSVVFALYGAVVLAENQIAYYQAPSRLNSYNVQPVQAQPQNIAVPVQVMNPQGANVPAIQPNVNTYMPTPQAVQDNDAFYQQFYHQ